MMKTRLLPSAIAAGAICALLSAAPAQAQTMDSRTEFTFNRAVEMPGVTLPPGTYIFRFVDTTTGRKVMQVVSKDASNKNYGMFLTINAQRPKASEDAELRFLETPAGAPAAVKTWWYPGNTTGREFIYPKSQARKLAQVTNTPVLTTQAESVTNDQMKTANLAYMAPSGQETVLTDEELVAAAANTEPVGAPASTAMAQSPVQVGQTASNRTRLPKTNTLMPLIGLLGVASLLGGSIRFRP